MTKQENASIRHGAEIDECTVIGSRLKHKEHEDRVDRKASIVWSPIHAATGTNQHPRAPSYAATRCSLSGSDLGFTGGRSPTNCQEPVARHRPASDGVLWGPDGEYPWGRAPCTGRVDGITTKPFIHVGCS